MKLNFENFKNAINKEYVIFLATGENNNITMRAISAIVIDNDIYFYTGNTSEKYVQMKANPNVAFSIGPLGIYYGQGKVEFLGSVLDEKNKELKEIYKKKYEGAFEISAPGEDLSTNEFVKIKLTILKEWIWDKEKNVPLGLAIEKF
ncbi:pyridoxamine 5'-phosphate oxidase family protein [Fusobacterium sp. PH5-44]|uniref:pyridoxamine 5'-phosphate oxidase family protein n=1 Tax=unclassified Fusobacterium TaxID=2648384 RepID=UPI003D1F3966